MSEKKKQAGPGQTATAGDAAAAREAQVAALEAEKRGYEVRGLKDRAKQVDDAIKAAQGEPKGRSKPAKDEA